MTGGQVGFEMKIVKTERKRGMVNKRDENRGNIYRRQRVNDEDDWE